MTVLDAAYWVVCVVLVVSGVTKLADPSATRAALVGLGLPAPRDVGRLLGAAEILLGAAGLFAAGAEIARVVAAAVCVAYVLFALLVLAAMRKGLEDCGCVGARPSRPSAGHVATDLGSAAVAGAAAAVSPLDLGTGLESLSPAAAIGVGAAVAVCAAALVALPR